MGGEIAGGHHEIVAAAAEAVRQFRRLLGADRDCRKVDLLKMRNITLYKDLFPINRLDIQIIAKLRMSSVFFEKE